MLPTEGAQESVALKLTVVYGNAQGDRFKRYIQHEFDFWPFPYEKLFAYQDLGHVQERLAREMDPTCGISPDRAVNFFRCLLECPHVTSIGVSRHQVDICIARMFDWEEDAIWPRIRDAVSMCLYGSFAVDGLRFIDSATAQARIRT